MRRLFYADTHPTFILERLLSLVTIALIANRVFFKTLSRRVNTSFMIWGYGQGVQNAKITDPKYLCNIGVRWDGHKVKLNCKLHIDRRDIKCYRTVNRSLILCNNGTMVVKTELYLTLVI